MRAAVRKAVGIVLIIAGLVAIPVPVIPGIPLIAAGAAILGNDHPVFRSGQSWLRSRGILKQERNQDELPNLQS